MNRRHPHSERRWQRSRALRFLFPVVGLLALAWFLVRVLPKPSRATYPCQRVAFPLASGFVIWLGGMIGAVAAIRKAKKYLTQSRYVLCAVLIGVTAGSVFLAMTLTDDAPLMADPPVSNSPIGEAKGLHPGRVAWVHDPSVTDWDGGTGEGNWWYEHVDAVVASKMVSRAIRAYSGVDDDRAAWDALFRHFNRERGKGEVGYTPGERIAIKLNLVSCFAQPGSNRVDDSYDKTNAWKDNIDNTPELVHALLDQLVHTVGVTGGDIWIGDSTALFPNYMYNKLHPDFPDVHYWDNRGTHGRTRAEYSDHRFYWSKAGLGPTRQDYVPVAYAEAEYLMNFAILKSHDAGGITVCGKNHYGSLIRLPPGDYRDDDGVWHGEPSNPAYYRHHDDLPSTRPQEGRYRNRVDFMCHTDIGEKTILYLIDGVLAGKNWNGDPEPWTLPPFEQSNGWPCSLFVSMDPVAIDSVALDFLLEQWPQHAGMAGTTDYLVEAARADDPPSGTFYDPNHAGDVVRSSSRGVYERWDNPFDKRYSRNLDPENGTGIELLFVDDDDAILAKADRPPAIDGQADATWGRTMWRLFPEVIDPIGGLAPEPDDFSGVWKVLWDDDGIYFLVEVNDDVLAHSSEHDATYWLDDNVEIYVDADNSKGEGQLSPNYDGLNDFQFGFRWGDPEVHLGTWSAPDTAGIVFSMQETASGYRLEASLPWSTLRARPDSLPPVATGTRIGMEIHITDNDEAGDADRDYKLAWNSQFDDTFQDASLMRTVSLSRDYSLGSTLVARGATWRYFKGTREASDPISLWRTPGFDDGSWPAGAAPLGYGDPPFGTPLDDMEDGYSSVFLRHRFELPGDLTITSLWLTAEYDDAFIAWINGTEVLRVNVPDGEPLHAEFYATASHESGRYEKFSLPPPYDYLAPGENLLAVQGFNVDLGSSDFKFDMNLWFKADPGSSVPASFVRGDSNGDGSVDVSDAVHMLLFLFVGTVTSDCEDARDADDDGMLNITDAVVILDFLFLGALPPPAPFPRPGRDPSSDALGCDRGI